MANLPKNFYAPFYVRFYYKAGTKMYEMHGRGPHFAACQTENEAIAHKEETLDQDPDVKNTEILVNERISQ